MDSGSKSTKSETNGPKSPGAAMNLGHKPCKRGHDVNDRYEKSGACSKCRRIYNVGHNRENRWRHRGILNEKGEYFTKIDYDRFYQVQSGCCKLCGLHQSELKKTLHVDHNHQTGLARGLLCSTCNSLVIHVLEIYPHLVEKGFQYLKG